MNATSSALRLQCRATGERRGTGEEILLGTHSLVAFLLYPVALFVASSTAISSANETFLLTRD